MSHVKTKQSQIACELSQMSIRDKARRIPALETRVWKQLARRENGINVEVRVGLELERKINRLAVRENQIHLRVRHAAGFDHVFDGGLLVRHPHHRLNALRSLEKHQQFVFEC